MTAEQKKLVTNYKILTDAESAYDLLISKISVTFTLLGCYKHDSDVVHTLSGGNLSTWIAGKTYKVESGATVKDVLDKALKEAGMSCSNPTGNYVESINGIGEFSNGSNSGWMYTLNGTHPNLGVAQQTVKDGDVIVFHYLRYKDAEIVYSIQHKKLLEMASKAGAIYRIDGTVLINRDIDFDVIHDLDVTVYPDSGKIGVWGKQVNKVYHLDDDVDYYEGE